MLIVWYYFLLLYEYIRMREAVVTHSYCCNTAVLDLHRSTSYKLPACSIFCLSHSAQQQLEQGVVEEILPHNNAKYDYGTRQKKKNGSA